MATLTDVLPCGWLISLRMNVCQIVCIPQKEKKKRGKNKSLIICDVLDYQNKNNVTIV